jgi:hypothetical protein
MSDDTCIVHAMRSIVGHEPTMQDIDASIESFMFRNLPALRDTDLPGELTGLLGFFDAIMMTRDCIVHMGLVYRHIKSDYNKTMWFHMFRGMLFTRPVSSYTPDCIYDAMVSKQRTYLLFIGQLDNMTEETLSYAERALGDICCQRGDFLIF